MNESYFDIVSYARTAKIAVVGAERGEQRLLSVELLPVLVLSTDNNNVSYELNTLIPQCSADVMNRFKKNCLVILSSCVNKLNLFDWQKQHGYSVLFFFP